MGVLNFSELVQDVQPDAVVYVPKSAKRTDNNAFVRAARKRQAVVMDAMTHWYTLSGSLGWKNEGDKYFVSGEDVFKKFFERVSQYFTAWNLVEPPQEAKPKQQTQQKLKLKTKKQTIIESDSSDDDGAAMEEDEKKKQEDEEDEPLFVMVFDKAQWVNPGKKQTQIARDKARSKPTKNKPVPLQPYGDDVEYSLAGVRPDATAVLQSIDIDRAINGRGKARTKLRKFLLDSLTASPPLLSWPHNTKLYIDSEEGVVLYRSNARGELYVDTDHVEHTRKFRNKLGEADLAAMMWVQRLQRTSVRMISKDADWPMLAVYHFWHARLRHQEPRTLIWDNDANIHEFDVHLFAKTLRTEYHCTREAIVAIGILSGCDYFDKGLATPQIGHESIYKGIWRYMRLTKDDKARPVLASLEGMRKALYHIYAHKLDCKPDLASLVVAKKPNKKMTLVLEADRMADVYVAYRLAFGYFCSFKCYDPTKDPKLAKPELRIDALSRIRAQEINPV